MIIDRKVAALLILLGLLAVPSYRLPADKPTDPNHSELPVFETKSPVGSLVVGQVNRGRSPSLSFSPREAYEPNGTMAVFLQGRTGWVDVEEVEFDKHLRTREVALPEEMAGQTVRLRISRAGGGASHLDSLTVAGATAVGLDERLTRKLSARDNDVVDTSEIEGQELEFRLPENSAPILELAGRIEAERISETPFLFPTENLYTEISTDSNFYEYLIGSSPGRLSVDGSLGAETLPEPFFSENPLVGSGHPQAPTTGWVMDDGEYLYVAIDFAADNTMDGGVDYTAVHVKGAEGMKSFRVSTQETDWGTPGFGYTDTVGWEHKVYEFAIPFVELDLDPGDAEGRAVELAFEAYGTATPTPLFNFVVNPNGVDPNTAPSGSSFTFVINYQDGRSDPPSREPKEATVWIDFDGDGMIDTATSGGTFPRFPPSIAVIVGALLLLATFAERRDAGKVLLAAALSALLVGTAIGCSGAGTSGTAGSQQEVYELEMVDPPWEPIEKTYATTITVSAEPRVYSFQFRFVSNDDQQVNSSMLEFEVQ